MEYCENCGAQYAEKAPFCSKCGQALAASPSRPAFSVPPGQHARLNLPAHGKTFDLGDMADITIGHEDPITGISPNVDLTPFGGDAAGVGRRQARLIYSANGWQIQDSHSTSGVFVNRRRISTTDEVFPLKSGDRIRLGTLELVFVTY